MRQNLAPAKPEPSSPVHDRLFRIERTLQERSLARFIKDAWPIIEPGTPYIHNWHIDAICDHLQAVSDGKIKNLVINIPPRHMKSTIVSVCWPAWEWIHKPHMRYVFASYAYALSIRDSVKTRRLIQSNWYQERWGDRYELVGDQNEKSRFENNHKGFRLATSVGGLGTGEGGDRIIVDDPHNVREAESDTIREGVLFWWDEVMTTRINDPKTGAKVIIMQRVHERDLSGHVIDKGTYDHLCIPARWEGESRSNTVLEFQDPREGEPLGTVLWPDRLPDDELKLMETDLGEYATAGQLQQNPAPREGGILKRHWWKFWYPPTVKPPRPVVVQMSDGSTHTCEQIVLPDLDHLQINQSWDMSFKDTQRSDFVVGGVWGKKQAMAYLLDCVRGKWNFPDTIREVLYLKRKWPLTRRIWVEDKANGPAVISTLQRSVPGLIPVTPEGDKEGRANAVSFVIESGNVVLPHPVLYPWVKTLLQECSNFPNATHDDFVDMVTQALRKMFGARGVDLTPRKHWLKSLNRKLTTRGGR